MRKSFRDDAGGATMVEFAIAAVPLVALLLALLEFLLVVATDVLLDAAAEEANRALFTGRAQEADMTNTEFKAEVCRLAVMIPCGDNLLVDVRAFGRWRDINLPKLLDSDGNFLISPTPDGSKIPGDPEQIIVIRVVSRYSVLMPGMMYFFRSRVGDTMILHSAQASVIQPYDD